MHYCSSWAQRAAVSNGRSIERDSKSQGLEFQEVVGCAAAESEGGYGLAGANVLAGFSWLLTSGKTSHPPSAHCARSSARHVCRVESWTSSGLRSRLIGRSGPVIISAAHSIAE